VEEAVDGDPTVAAGGELEGAPVALLQLGGEEGGRVGLVAEVLAEGAEAAHREVLGLGEEAGLAEAGGGAKP
jgi:hypothetical protein